MSETSTTGEFEGHVGDAIESLSSGLAYALSAIKWIVLLNFGIGYAAFIGMVVRLHYLHGDVLAVVLTALVYLLVPAAVVGRRFVRRTDSADGDTGIAARVQKVV